ncbi:MAG: tryptophan halogenase family protein [Woeseiaceae bacterium]
MAESNSRVVIVGGGSAGWITACVIAAEQQHSDDRRPVITVIESPDIPIIGVGEGTWPSMRLTLQKIGLREADLVRECGASYKQGTQFVGWAEPGAEQQYVHPFSFPLEYSNLNLAGFWLEHRDKGRFAEMVTPQAQIVAAGLAPKQVETPEYAFNVNYGYHLDAGRFAELLHRHAVEQLGVQYVSANVAEITQNERGDIAELSLDTGETVQGDLFVDCTGQKALLIGDQYGVELESVTDVLFNDTAIAVQVPHATSATPIPSATLSTATEAGWIWDIALQQRRGVGHVFSSTYLDSEAALKIVQDYVARTSPNVAVDDLSYREISFAPGYRKQLWVNNCVAVGLSGGFVEPLEASALALIEQAASMIGQQLPANRDLMPVVARRFNARMAYHWERIIEFLKLHYVLSRRSDSKYWEDCRDLAACPEGLRDKLAVWEQQPPWHDDSPRVDELFPSASYQYVLYGMGFDPTFPYSPGINPERDQRRAAELVRTNAEKTLRMINLLPTNRELIDAVISRSEAA